MVNLIDAIQASLKSGDFEILLRLHQRLVTGIVAQIVEFR